MKLTKLMKLGVVVVLVGGGIFLVSRFVGQTLPGAVRSESTVEPREGLVGHWNFDDQDVNGATVFDKSGTGNNMTNNGATSGVAGKINQAFDFDSTDDLVKTSATGLPAINGSQTLSAWFKVDSNPAGANNLVVLRTSADSAANQLVMVSGNIGMYKWGGGTIITTTAPTAGEWHLFTWTNDGTTNRLYIDGVEKTNNTTALQSGSVGTIYFSTYNGTSEAYDGLLDEVRIYNRALSAAEVTQLYNASKRAEIVNAPSRTGLVGYWNLDDESISGTTVFDKSGLGGSGTINGNPITGVAGKINQAITYDGSGDFISIPNHAALNVNGTTAVSVGAWMKLNSTSGPWRGIVSKGAGQQYAITTNGTDNYIHFETNQMSVSCGALNTPNNSIVQNTWHHIMATYNGVSKKVYIDGVERASSACTSTFNDNTQNLFIGSDGGTEYFIGDIDEARVYNRALSATEILAQYNHRPTSVLQSQNSANTSGLVGLWSFNGQDMDWASTTAEALDRSGNGNNGDVTNFGQGSVRPGKVGQALSFDGSDDYIAVGNVSNSVGAISFWMKPNSTTQSVIDLNGTNSISMTSGTLSLAGGSGVIAANASSTKTFANVSSTSWTHTTGGSDRLLTVSIGALDTAARTVTGVTYNSVAMTQVDRASQTNDWVELWYLENPTIGANTVAVTFSGTVSHGGVAGATSFTGVAQSSSLAQKNKSSVVATSISTSITDTTSGNWLVDALHVQDDTPSVSGSGQVQSWKLQRGTDDWGGQSYTASGGGTVTLSWSISGGNNRINQVVGEFNAASGAADATIYVDGVVSSTVPDTDWHQVVIVPDSAINASAVDIGRVASTYFNGQIDEVRVYNRTLTAAEVLELYQGR
jgi:hypothetical protein